MATLLVGIPLIFILTFNAVKMFIPDWSSPDRGFAMFEKSWPKIFTIAGIGATLLAVTLDAFTPASTSTALVVGVISGLLGIAGYTDGTMGKVPSEISNITINLSVVLGLGALLINSLNLTETQRFFESVAVYTPGDPLLWMGAGFVIGLIGFLGWMRLPDTLALISIIFSALGFWLLSYVGLKTLSVFLGNTFGNIEFWNTFMFYGSTSILAFVIFTMAFELGAGNKIGGADLKSVYAAGWAFAGLIGPTYLALSLIVASVLQLLIHLFANVLKVGGYKKEYKNGALIMAWLRLKWKLKKLEGEPPTTRQVLAMPFLPIMNASIIGVVICVITGALTFSVT